MIKFLREFLLDMFVVFWDKTKWINPRSKHDLFYGRFAVLILSITQLPIVLLVFSRLGIDWFEIFGRTILKIAIILLACTLALLNSVVIYYIDDKLKSHKIGKTRTYAAGYAIILYFMISIACIVVLFKH